MAGSPGADHDLRLAEHGAKLVEYGALGLAPRSFSLAPAPVPGTRDSRYGSGGTRDPLLDGPASFLDVGDGCPSKPMPAGKKAASKEVACSSPDRAKGA